MRVLSILCCTLLLFGCGKKNKKIDFLAVPEKKIETVKQESKGVIFPVNQVETPQPEKEIWPLIVHFDFDSDKVRPEDEAALRKLALELNGQTVTIKGYTCPVGTKSYNLDLSKRRAVSVSAYIENYIVFGYGETNLVTSDSREYWKNRRVVVEVFE